MRKKFRKIHMFLAQVIDRWMVPLKKRGNHGVKNLEQKGRLMEFHF